MKPIGSLITTPPGTPASPTGLRPGATGVAAMLTSAETEAGRARLAGLTPTEADLAAASSIRSSGVGLTASPSAAGNIRLAARDDLTADLPRALRAARCAVVGPTEGQIEEWGAKLASATARAPRSGAEDRLMFETWAEHLRGLPLDCVREAMSPARWKFWPALREVLDVAEGLARKRRTMLAALETLVRQSAQERGERWRSEALEAWRGAEILAARGDEAEREKAWARACAAKAEEFGVTVDLGARARIAARVAAMQAQRPTPQGLRAEPRDAAAFDPTRPAPPPSEALKALYARQAARGWG